MCIIIDTNMAHMFGNPFRHKKPQLEMLPVLERLTRAELDLALGGELTVELDKLKIIQELVNALEQAGRVRRYSDSAVEERTNALINAKSCKSNDQHVIALAQISGARVLCTRDKDLIQDFTNPALIGNPQGEVYQQVADEHLLENPPPCRPSQASSG